MSTAPDLTYRIKFAAPDLSHELIQSEIEIARKLRDATGFWEHQLFTAAAPRPVEMPAAPVRTAVLVSTEGPDAEYVALAKEIGFTCPAILQSRLETFFAENFIDVYPYDRVKGYMDALAQNEGAERGMPVTWVWRSLREPDLGMAITPGSGVYNKPVPYPVLLTVKRVGEAFPEVGFFVSDYEAVKPDPFLMVTAPGLPRYVIERWDEPGFRP